MAGQGGNIVGLGESWADKVEVSVPLSVSLGRKHFHCGSARLDEKMLADGCGQHGRYAWRVFCVAAVCVGEEAHTSREERRVLRVDTWANAHCAHRKQSSADSTQGPVKLPVREGT